MKAIIRTALTLPALLLLTIAAASAQESVQVKDATGSCVIANITPEKAKETALFNAKIEALRMAGIPEQLLSEITQAGEMFTEASVSNVGGDVTNYKVTSEDIEVMQQGKAKVMVYKVVINATVVKYDKKADPTFQLQVDGIKSAYKEKELLSFTVTPHQNGYLRIFLFEEDGSGEQIYPDGTREPDMIFTQDGTIKFPLDGYYVLSKSDRTKAKEINSLLFLFFKDDIRFAESHITRQAVDSWKAKIPLDRRTQVFREFAIER
ncbi:hypothetical protein AGMMS49574_07590 [Bacteroidia bacterium]|nr:hypothetical protein AGMMS49574_07590 [Bacteroidia bacterium]